MTQTTDRSTELEARIAWSHMTEPGDRLAAELITKLGAAEGLRFVVSAKCAEASQSSSVPRWLSHYDADAVKRDLDLANKQGLTTIIPGDELWPTRLDEIGVMDARSPAGPIMLWIRGDASLLALESLAIAGARACTGYGAHVTADIADHVGNQGVTVISGAAYGIDAAAHRAALSAGSKTVAVLAGGVDRAYPASHDQLLDKIAETGAVVSELPPGAAPTRHRFLMRGRLIAGLSTAVLVTEAGIRSGTMHLAEQAHGMGRPIGAVPGPVTSAARAGCHKLLRERTAQLVTSVDEALQLVRHAGDARDN